MNRRFRQVDVFTDVPYAGNPVAVVLDADDLDTDTMQRVARWTNLSETTYVMAPTSSEAHYQVRIFTPVLELPFAGHPTLGTCHAWLAAQAEPPATDVLVQECPAGLIRVRRTADGLAFAAPPLLRTGPVDEALVIEAAAAVGLQRDQVLAAEWVDNGPGWIALLLASPEEVLALRPGPGNMDVGVVALYAPGSAEMVEVRAFFPKDGMLTEDPVTGSFNASLGQWLTASGRITTPYVARQGTAIGRSGRVHVSSDDDGQIWVGGGTVTCVEGTIEI